MRAVHRRFANTVVGESPCQSGAQAPALQTLRDSAADLATTGCHPARQPVRLGGCVRHQSLRLIREVLKPEEFEVFSRLRDWRRAVAEKEGVPMYFTIHDPKERTICAASFRERVLHQAVMNVCEPVFERAAVFDSYCGVGGWPLDRAAVAAADAGAGCFYVTGLQPAMATACAGSIWGGGQRARAV